MSYAQKNQQPFKLGDEPSIQEVIDAILAEIPTDPVKDTVDTVKSGDPRQKLKGIATSFLPTCEVISKAGQQGANLLIVHEPTYYGHRDEVDWLGQDPVYQFKRKLLEDYGIVTWRFHDYWHRVKPDPVTAALLADLGLSDTENHADNSMCTIAATSLGELAASFKERLGLPFVRVIGDADWPCRRVCVLPGAWGGRAQMGFLARERPDVLVCGEINEWETAIYVKDAIAARKPTSLIILGHVQTEEPGMRLLVDWLKPRLPNVPIVHIPMNDPFRYV